MNPFTDSLLQKLNNPALSEYVSYWDRAEALVIRVYKDKAATDEDAREWRALRGWLLAHHPEHAPALAACWPRTRIGPEPTTEDPFDWLLSYRDAMDFVGEWHAMQTLPAIREALNLWLVDLIERSSEL
jgi:hypothetical protein